MYPINTTKVEIVHCENKPIPDIYINGTLVESVIEYDVDNDYNYGTVVNLKIAATEIHIKPQE